MIAEMQNKFLEKEDPLDKSLNKTSNLKKLIKDYSKPELIHENNEQSIFDDSSWWFVSDTIVQQ